MTVQELRDALKDVEGDMEVRISVKVYDGLYHSLKAEETLIHKSIGGTRFLIIT